MVADVVPVPLMVAVTEALTPGVKDRVGTAVGEEEREGEGVVVTVGLSLRELVAELEGERGAPREGEGVTGHGSNACWKVSKS